MTPRLAIITNDAAWAALQALACHPGNLPASVDVIDQPDRMLALPDGVAFICFWRGDRYETVDLEDVWARRRARGGVEPASDADWAKLAAFAERQAARDRAVLYGEAEAATLPSHDVALGPSRPQIDSLDRSVPPAASAASKPARGEVNPLSQASRWH